MHELLQVNVLFEGAVVACLRLGQLLKTQCFDLLFILALELLNLALMVKFLLFQALTKLNFFQCRACFVNYT